MKPILIPIRTFALATMIALVGCSACAPSNAALRGHSTAAQTLDDLADDAKKTVLELRQVELDKAAVAAHDAGLMGNALTAEVQKAATKFDSGPAIGAVNAFIAAKDLYVRGVLMAASKDPPSWTTVKPILKDVIAAYNAMREALGKPDKMPPIPPAIAELLSRADRIGEDSEVVS